MHETDKIEILFEAYKLLSSEMKRKHDYYDDLINNCGTTIQRLQKEVDELKKGQNA